MPEASRTALTYRYERWRALSSGVLETAGATFLLLIAVRWFEAGALSKALVAAGAGRPFDNNSPAELGARTVEILEAAYRSSVSGAAERVKALA